MYTSIKNPDLNKLAPSGEAAGREASALHDLLSAARDAAIGAVSSDPTSPGLVTYMQNLFCKSEIIEKDGSFTSSWNSWNSWNSWVWNSWNSWNSWIPS